MELDRKKVEALGLNFDEEIEGTDSLEKSYNRCAKLLSIFSDKYDELEDQVEENSKSTKSIEQLVKENTTKVASLEEKIDALTTATEGLVSAWTTANNVQKFIKWISGIGVLAMVITWIISILPDSWTS